MAKYTAANHTIESDTGEFLAKLSDSIRADQAFSIADNWGDSATEELRDQIEDLGCEVQRAEDRADEFRKDRDHLAQDNESLKSKIEELQDRIAALETELETEKGDAQ